MILPRLELEFINFLTSFRANSVAAIVCLTPFVLLDSCTIPALFIVALGTLDILDHWCVCADGVKFAGLLVILFQVWLWFLGALLSNSRCKLVISLIACLCADGVKFVGLLLIADQDTLAVGVGKVISCVPSNAMPLIRRGVVSF